MVQNNVTRFLNARKIKYELFEIPGGKQAAKETAKFLNVPENCVFKTIVLKPVVPGKPILAVISANQTADLKKIAKLVNHKKIEFPEPHEAEKMTGLQTGGISALALINKGFNILLDESAISMEWIHISGGQIGLNIKIKVSDFVKLTNAKIAVISNLIE